MCLEVSKSHWLPHVPISSWAIPFDQSLCNYRHQGGRMRFVIIKASAAYTCNPCTGVSRTKFLWPDLFPYSISGVYHRETWVDELSRQQVRQDELTLIQLEIASSGGVHQLFWDKGRALVGLHMTFSNHGLQKMEMIKNEVKKKKKWFKFQSLVFFQGTDLPWMR